MRRFFAGVVLLITAAMHAQSPASRLRIGAGDLINVEVFDVPELKQELRVSDAGDAEFLILGRLHIGGMTVEDAEDLVATQLKQRLLVTHPQVTLLIREYATQGVAVSGEVRKPGIYQVLGPRTLLQVTSEAGGLTELASPKISLRHRDGTEEVVLAGKAAEVTLSPGDTVFVPRTGIAYVVGDVVRAGGYAMHDKGELSIAQLVALGGGLLPTAKGSKATLVRRSAEQPTQVDVNVDEILRGQSDDVQLQADDILFIPNSILKTTATRLQNITQMAAGAAIYTSLN
jgi:polysaccharide export outer membrane protein